MVRVLSIMALAAAAVAAAATPTVAVPAMAAQRAVTPTFPSIAAATSVVSTMRGMALARQEKEEDGLPDLNDVVLSALEPLWEAYKAGQFDDAIAAFKAGEFDDDLPSQELVLATMEQVFAVIRKTVPKVYKLLDEVKAGTHDEFLREAKEGSLEDFLLAIADALFGDIL